MAAVDITAEEAYGSVTGFEEIAIKKAFGKPVDDLASEDVILFGRALVFVVKRREGLSDNDAFEAAMSLTRKDAGDYFADDESGKDDSTPSEPQPEN